MLLLLIRDISPQSTGSQAEDWMVLRGRMMSLLQDEAELDEIVKLVGMDALSASDRLKMEVARSIREDFLHQLAFHEVDTYTSLDKQLLMMKLILKFYDEAADVLNKNGDIEKIASLAVREAIGRFKYVEEKDINTEYEKVNAAISEQMQTTIVKEEF